MTSKMLHRGLEWSAKNDKFVSENRDTLFQDFIILFSEKDYKIILSSGLQMTPTMFPRGLE